MSTDNLRQSWERTTGFLRDARSHISEAGETICADEISQFEEFLSHNELELALEELHAAFQKSEFESWRMLELMALAAASMGLIERQRQYDAQLSEARGWKYETSLGV
jgi:hypothetical protein